MLLPRPRKGLRGIVFTQSVCVSDQYFGILFLGYMKRYRSEIHTGYL